MPHSLRPVEVAGAVAQVEEVVEEVVEVEQMT